MILLRFWIVCQKMTTDTNGIRKPFAGQWRIKTKPFYAFQSRTTSRVYTPATWRSFNGGRSGSIRSWQSPVASAYCRQVMLRRWPRSARASATSTSWPACTLNLSTGSSRGRRVTPTDPSSSQIYRQKWNRGKNIIFAKSWARYAHVLLSARTNRLFANGYSSL